jgi:ArsR family transcriptional regulator, arsenate/arsenite/antimonite-responsive transcriptional repressor / arsenate reductase (thioredoxin)
VNTLREVPPPIDDPCLTHRSERHAALGEPVRLAIVDELRRSDRSPVDLARALAIPSNLLAHHLGVLEAVGLVARRRSSGDGRRRYVRLLTHRVEAGGVRFLPSEALFVCTRNSARSQLAAALWPSVTGHPARSAGTHPSPAVHPEAVAAAARRGFDLSAASPRRLDELPALPPLVITVCDRANEELGAPSHWLHWSVPDPVVAGTSAAFDDAADELLARIHRLSELAVPS